MEGTHSSVPEAAVALFLSSFHHTLLIRSFLIILFLLSRRCNWRLMRILKLLLTLFAFKWLILASLPILFGILVNYDVIGDIVDVVGTIAILLTEWLHIWVRGVLGRSRISLQYLTGRDYFIMFVSQVLVNYLIFWINHSILFLAIVLVGCGEVADVEHGYSLVFWIIVGSLLLPFLSQVHHGIITISILTRMMHIFDLLFRRVIIQLRIFLMNRGLVVLFGWSKDLLAIPL